MPSSLTTTSGATFPASLLPLSEPIPTIISSLKPNPPDHIAIGAFIIQSSPSPKILVLRRSSSEISFPLRWEVPGGGAEDPPIDNTLLDAVPREVLEETGLRVLRILGQVIGPKGEQFQEFQGMKIDPVTGCTRTWRKWNFFVEVEWNGVVALADDEHVDWKWLGKEELGTVKFTGDMVGGWIAAAFDQWEKINIIDSEEQK